MWPILPIRQRLLPARSLPGNEEILITLYEAQKLFDLVKQCGARLGQDIGWQPTGGVCDGNNIAAAGVPVVDTMGVRGGAIHSAEEFMIVPSLVERAALSAQVLERLASGDPL